MYKTDYNQGGRPVPNRTPQSEGAARALIGMAGLLRHGIAVVAALGGGTINPRTAAGIENDAALIEGYGRHFAEDGDIVFSQLETLINETAEQSANKALAVSGELAALVMLRDIFGSVQDFYDAVAKIEAKEDEQDFVDDLTGPFGRPTVSGRVNPFGRQSKGPGNS
jgi:hypothetical protein